MSCHVMQCKERHEDGTEIYECTSCDERWSVNDATGVTRLTIGYSQITEGDQEQMRQMLAEGERGKVERWLESVPNHLMERVPPHIEFAMHMCSACSP